MHFYDLIKKLSEEKDIMLFVDMDGVLASYDVGNPSGFTEKRPLKQNIENIRKVSEIENVEVYILSMCRHPNQIEEKNIWLDKYAPFFKKENRNIIARENEGWRNSKDIKTEFLQKIKTDKQLVLLDDDNTVLKEVMRNVENIIVLQDSELVD